MDDLEFRRRAYADPDCQDTNFIDKKMASVDNRNLVDELCTLNQRIQNALHVPAAEGLAQRIILQQTLGNHYRKRNYRHVLFALAASVVFGLAILFTLLQPSNSNSLQQDVLAHVYNELDHLTEQQNKSTVHINDMLAAHGARIDSDIGRVNYLGSCTIAGKPGIHIVLPGSKGAVTVLMLPDIPVEHTLSFSDNRFQGLIIPARKGSMAIIGEHDENLKTVQTRLSHSFNWLS